MNEERFADQLDRIVSGQPPQEEDALATFAHDLQTQQGAARLDPDRRAEIRRKLMLNATSMKPTHGGNGPLSQPALIDPAARNPWVRRTPVPNRTPAGWRGNIVKAQTAIAIMTVFTILIVGFAWYTNGPGSSGPAPSATRYAAAPTEIARGPESTSDMLLDARQSGNTEATSTVDPDWKAPITAQECMPREPRTFAERNVIISGTPDFPQRAYGPATTASEGDAADVAITLRHYQACVMADTNADGYVSDRFVRESSALAPDAPARDDEAKLRAGQEVSELYQDVDPNEFVIVTDAPEGTPPTSMRIVESPGVYQPQHARQMADGRIALPSTLVFPEGMLPQGRTAHIGNVYLLSESDDGWVVDEMLLFCIGDCDGFWAAMEQSADQPATPIPAAPVEESTPLLELLAVLPPEMTGIGTGTLNGWVYADIEQRFEDLGLTEEALAEDPMLPLGTNAYAPLAPTTRLFDFAADEEFVEAIGFNPLTVQQVLIAGATPDGVTLLRGDWDADQLVAAWEASGYTPHTAESGVTIWSLDPDGMVDPEHPIQSRMFQELNNVVILDDGILAYAGNLGTLERVIRADTGETAVAIDAPWNSIVIEAVPEQSVSSIGFNQPGSTLYDLGEIATNPNLRSDDQESLIEEPLRESREAVGAMPEYIGAIFSFVEGENGNGEAVVQLGAMNEQSTANMIEVFEWRWQSFTSPRYQRTFDSILPLIDARAEGTIVTLRFDTQGAPSLWQEILLGDGLIAFAVDAGLPIATPEATQATPMAISDEDAAWWTWPAAEECRPEEYSGDALEPADYPEREYVPLGTADREDAEAASRAARTTTACFVPYSSVPFSTSRFQQENNNLGADPYEYGQTLKAQNENGRAISEAFPIKDPTEFGRLTDEEPILLTPPPLDSGMGGLTSNVHKPYTAVFIPSHAVQLADGRIAIPESLLGMKDDEELAYRGDPTTWVRHYGSLVVLSDESGTWLIDEILPFCIGPDCHVFWEQNAETADRILGLGTPDATPTATPEALAPQSSPVDGTPGDPRMWSECPDDAGPNTLTMQNGHDSYATPPPSVDDWLPEPAQPPTIPCPSPGPATPEDVIPVPLD